MTERNIDAFAVRLGDPNLELKVKYNLATELRDNVDGFCVGASYAIFLKKLVPVFMKLLEGPPVFTSTSWEQRLRNCILEIFHRLPMNPAEVLKPYAAGIVDVLMGLVRTENEDNAVLCMKTVMDLERHQVEATAGKVQPFLELIQEMFETMEQVVKDTFDSPAQASGSTPGNSQSLQYPRPGSPSASVNSDLGIEQQTARPLLKGMQSFKVLAECPIIVVSLFQAHRNCVHANVKKFVPLIKGVLLHQAKPQERAHAEAAARGKIFTGVSREIKNRAAFGEFVTAQVKTMSFLAYLLRVYSQQLQDFLTYLPDIVVRLLKDCPSEKSATRKELLVAIRHIVNFNFRRIFLPKIDDLLEERTLIGDGLTVYETMRPLAYSMLADLIHHVREQLTRDQIRRTVEVFSKNLHDNFPGTSFQTMSAKLLLNLAESIAGLENKQDARHFLIMILSAIGDKFAAMNRQYHNAVKLSKLYEQQSVAVDAVAEDHLADKDHPPDWDEVDIFTATPIKTSNPRDRGANPVEDNKFLFKNLMTGLKNMFYQLKFCNPLGQPIDPANEPVNWQEVSYGYNAEEVEVIIKLFREGSHVFRYYGPDQQPTETHYSSPVEFLANNAMALSGKEEKDLLETFATVFHCIDPATFHEVFHTEIPHLYEMMFEHTALLHIPQFFLASEATSPSFAGMLLQFLMDRIGDVGTSNIKQSSVLLRLFKLSFMAVTLFSQQNEQVLLPHVSKIVTKAIQLSTTAEEPMNYFLLLRSLFRSIGGGRFELLYKEILPLLEMLLEVLNNLLLAARKPQERDLYVELCLTVPARLSNLLPHLSYLMRPLVVALRAGSDLVGQGLRTLELCVDNLTADYLDPIMAPVIDELMTALWDHLRPNPYSHFHAHTTMRILGKLGGRNRKFLNGPPALTFRKYADDECSIDIKLVGSNKERAFPASIGIDLAIAKLMDVPKAPAAKNADGFYKQQALRLLTAQLKMHIGFDVLPDDFALLVRSQANDLIDGKLNIASDSMEKTDREKSVSKKEAQEEIVKKLLKACMLATTIVDLRSTAINLLADVCRHFTLLELGRSFAQLRHMRKPFDVKSGEGPLCIDSRILADAIVESLSSDNIAIREAAEQSIRNVYEAAAAIFGSADKVEKLPFFVYLARTFCHNCHEEEWYTKAGGGLGISILATKTELGDSWLVDRQVEFVRALIYIIKDMPQDLPANTRVQAQHTLEELLRRCNKGISKDEIHNHQTKLYNICGFLIYELAHMNRNVREATQKAFAIIAEVIGAEVHELLAPVKDRLLQPIYNKPLRALPFAVQIGYIEAITFCLGLQHGLVEFTDPLNRLLMESLALADAEDDTLAAKPTEQRTAESIINLRVSCIRLLSLAVGFPEFAGQPQNQSRGRIISVFFKSLYSRSSEVIDAANAGLKGVLTQTNKLPKDLLQNGLRPILMNLQDPKKLSVAGLDGLARLLTLLTNYFKVEIGQRLLDHMKAIADGPALQKTSFTLIEQNLQMKVVSATLNIFHLLPPAATRFMSDLVNRVLDLEDKLRRTHYSPFREPLLKYLNRYPKETWAFFSTRLHEITYGRFYAQLLADKTSAPMRAVLTADIDGLVQASLDLQDPEKKDAAIINAIHLAHSLVAYSSDWLVSRETLRQALLSSGRYLNGQKDLDKIAPNLRLAAEQAGEQLMDIFVAYLGQQPPDHDFLFQLIDAITSDDIKPYPSIYTFIYQKIISSESTEYWRSIIIRCLELYSSRSSTQKTKTFAFRNLVNPILAMDIMRSTNSTAVSTSERPLMDKSLAEAIHNKLWKPQLTDIVEDNGQPGVDHSRLELLQMSALLLKYHHNLVSEARKDIIKFGWSYIRLEDTINKHAAYVLISYFIAQFETPSKIVNQIYVALLRAHQNEGRALVIQALDLMAPVLPKRLTGQGNDPRFPMWSKWPKRILSEESSNLQQLISIFQFMVRHPELFYEAREHFIPHIIPSLVKIAQPPYPLNENKPNPSNENKKLVLNLIKMIWQWEERRVLGPERSTLHPPESPQSKKLRLDGSHTSSSSPAPGLALPANSERTEYLISVPLRTMLIKYLAQFITSLPERYPVPAVKLRDIPSAPPLPPLPPNDIAKKALTLFHDLLSPGFWTDLEVDLFPRTTEQILASEKTDKPDDKAATSIINTLLIVRVIVNMKGDDWIISQLGQIQRLLEKPLRLENPEVQDCLHTVEDILDDRRQSRPIVRRVLDALPKDNTDEDQDMEVDTPSTEFVTSLSAVATETMSAGNYLSSINILWTLAQVKPAEIDQHLPQIMRALQQKMAKDHVAAQMPGQMGLQQGLRPGEVASYTPDPREMEIQTQLIFKTIDLMSLRMATLGEQRRPFLSVLASLVERSQNIKLCEKILGMVETWVFDSNEPWPTLKEKTAVLHKMLLFESRPDPTLLHKFLDLVTRIYEDPKITRTELTVRLEHAFLVGTRAQDVETRNRLMGIFDRSLTRSANARLIYVLTSQNWDTLAESFWLSQAIQLIFGSIEMATPAQLHPDDFKMMPPSLLFSANKDTRRDHVMLDDKFEDFINDHRRFCSELGDVKVRDILEPLCQLQHTDSNVAYQIWVALFPLCWSALSRDDRMELEKGMVVLLTRDYHSRQVDRRPYVVQALLEGVVRVKPRFKLPPHVMKFLSKTYDAWYTAAVSLEESAITPLIDTPSVRESNLDALVEIYAGLQEDDLFYGTWRRRCKFVETNAALSYEQNGMWDKAQQLYEAAQIKARTGAVPFSQGEYMLWEDHWVICAQKLQQWEILSDFAKHENFNDLLLESAWRNFETWSGQENLEQLNSIIKAVSDAPTPRRTFFQAFMSLLKLHDKSETPQDFSRICDESIQLSIRKWHQLPKRITNAHVPILQNFQQLVELHDASLICASLGQTNQANLDQKSQELKLLLGTWRDRLPNIWDDINAWQDLVTWRQHIFQLINRTYLALLPPQQGNATGNSYAYRGYHETAWIINRFAHVARKHQLPDVCINQLSRIYTLPNIEIQEAFLKLREQAKCHYQNPLELNSGLDVINNTNLNYFGVQQKAEFFTLKGMFLAKLDHKDEANDAFGTALYYDIRLPKAWAEWGYYNDSMFKVEKDNTERAAAAVSCYLEAAGLYKNAKSRKLLSRILWLLSLDDAENRISRAFEDFKGETPVWYWITFIPQLLTSLSHREARLSRAVLVKIAKIYPQALYFLLRTNREDMVAIKKQQDQKQERINKAKQNSPAVKQGTPDGASRPGTATSENPQNSVENGTSGTPKREPNGQAQPTPNQEVEQPAVPKKPWEYSDEIMSVLKTAFPLLALSMETMVDQIQKHFKCPPDEDAYRLIVALLNDGLAYIGRMPAAYAQDFKLPPATEANIRKFAETILPNHIRSSFEEEFVAKRPTMHEYIHKLRRWRDKFEEKLDRRPQHQSLELYSPHLSEFRFQKFDEVEVPGQYLQHRDKNQDFVRIERFLPDVDLVRSVGFSHRRLKIRGHDGSVHPFAIQHPAARHCRREERILQLFRIFNGVLAKRKESRRRNLNFFLPLMIPLAPSIRLVQDDASYVSLQGVFEDHCRRHGANKDDPVLFTMDRMRTTTEMRNNKYPEQAQNLRMEAYTAIQDKWVPNTIALEYFQNIYPSFADFWLFRRQFSYQFAALTFMTYIMHMNNRYPHKLSIARTTGNIWGSELIPAMANNRPLFHNHEPVPFRLTPNLQTLMGPLATEGIYSCAIMAIARCLTEPDFELEQQLSIFVRDEMIFWFTQQHRGGFQDHQLRDTVQGNSEIVVKKAVALARPPEGNLPANQTVIDLISRAVNPLNLAQTDALWMPYL
ncbi:histone acetylase complex subunit [Lasallia pustulata]|uniref:Histone acetylase complex subunit n=1 Tax=Lasallia pustulata TaxID=136370 RepID=A0A1W5CVU6_9LECA|nr:histone acetylase complex subunit [Lasallia pustulata]